MSVRPILILVVAPFYSAAAGPDGDEPPTGALAAEAEREIRRGQTREAIERLDRAIEKHADDPELYLLRASARHETKEYSKGIADCDRALALDAKLPRALDLRGHLHLKLGRFRKAIADYDRFLELAPAREPHHWQRGIACYYAGEYEKGRKQFEAYQTVDANDVENVVWRYLCMAKSAGPDKARREILPVGRDPRVPLEEVYELFRGRATPEDVIAAAMAGEPTPEELRGRLFYAHLYIGLFHEAHEKRDLARKHIRLAATRHAVDHFMGDVARMHARRCERSAETEERDRGKSERDATGEEREPSDPEHRGDRNGRSNPESSPCGTPRR